MLPIEISAIRGEHLQNLVDNGVAESRFLEYKREVPGENWHRDRFLATAVSFANEGPGDLILGVNCEGGVPTEIIGFELQDVDAEVLRLDQLIRDNFDPTYHQHRIQPVALPNGRTAIVIRLPLSYERPHRVGSKGPILGRGAAGKVPLDMLQVRNMILQGQEYEQRIRSFRADRILSLTNGQAPVQLDDGAIFVVHLIPLQAIASRAAHTAPDMGLGTQYFTPLVPGHGMSHLYNLEGTVFYVPPADATLAYTHVYRSGIIEATYTCTHQDEDSGRLMVPLSALCRNVVDAIPRWVSGLEQLQIGPPFYLMLSMYNLGDAIVPRNIDLGLFDVQVCDRDTIAVPEIELVWPTNDLPASLQPLFDMLWQSWGFEKSHNYDLNDVWRG